MNVSWDDGKDAANTRKHGLSFEEASVLLRSGHYLEIFDVEHSDDEERFIAIGIVSRGLIVVVWTETADESVRIVSARFATKGEEELYESYRGRTDE